MGALLTCVVIALLLAAAAFQLAGKHRVSCWLLVVFPGFLCLAYLRDLVQGPQRIGLSAYASDQKQVLVATGMLAVSVFAVFRSQWRWFFWIEWILNGIVCGMLVYLVFFWKVFQ
ncbi:MAG: hypothetical protein WCC26_10540 [Terracidiphilus sp.]